MAEQHQNMQQKHQQQQLVNSALASRSFTQDTFSAHMNQLRSSNYLPGTNPNLSSPKTPNSNHIFNTFDRQMNSLNSFSNNEPLNNLPMSPNNIFDSRTSNVLSEIEHSKQPGCVSVQQQHHHQHLQQQDHHQQQLQQKQPPQQPQQQQQQPSQLQKPPAYPSSRQLPQHFSESSQLRLQNPVSNQHQPRAMSRQFSSSMQMVQTQISSNQGHLGVQQVPPNSHNVSQQQHHMMSHSAQYTNFSSQQSSNNPTFHISMSQNMTTYSPQFSSSSNQAMNTLHHANRPPPEYKAHQSVDNTNLIDQLKASTSQVMYVNPSGHKDNLMNKHQRPPNVTIMADGSVIRTSSALDWRHMINEQQSRGNPTLRSNYVSNNFGRSEHSVQQPQIFNQYRVQDNQMVSNRMIRPNQMVPTQMIMQQQRPRINAPQRPRNQSPIEQQQHASVGISNNNALAALSSGFSNRHDMNRSDGMLNLDFLDNIESSASDLLNFDQVMQEGATNFPLLDDMEILGK